MTTSAFGCCRSSVQPGRRRPAALGRRWTDAARVARVVQDLGAVRLDAPAHTSFTARPGLEPGHCRDGHDPALVGVKAPDLEGEHVDARGRRAQAATRPAGASPIAEAGMPFGITIGLTAASHIRCFMYRLTVVRSWRGPSCRPVDAMEAEGVVRVPQHHDAVPQAAAVQASAMRRHRPRRCATPRRAPRRVCRRATAGAMQVVDHASAAALEFQSRDLVLLAVVHAGRDVARDPLAPAVEAQPPPPGSRPRAARDRRRRTGASRSPRSARARRELLHAHPEAARLAVLVGPLEAQDRRRPSSRSGRSRFHLGQDFERLRVQLRHRRRTAASCARPTRRGCPRQAGPPGRWRRRPTLGA